MTEELKYKVGDKVLIEAELKGISNCTGKPELYIKGFGTFFLNYEGFDNIVNLPPRPKVKQVVMDYYTQNVSADHDYDEWFERSGMPDGIASWLYCDGDDDILMQRQHALATLITYGPQAVEVEKEQKYIVEIPNPNSRDLKNSLRLVRAKGGDVIILASANITDNFYLTESEIKKDFQWAWDAGFAKPAEEVED